MGLEEERRMLTGSGDPQEEKNKKEVAPASGCSAESKPESSTGFATATDKERIKEEEEEELVDPLTKVREQCEQLEKCVKAREQLELCDQRVSSRSQTEEDCTEELFDFLHARDHCVAHKLFSSLK